MIALEGRRSLPSWAALGGSMHGAAPGGCSRLRLGQTPLEGSMMGSATNSNNHAATLSIRLHWPLPPKGRAPEIGTGGG